ncbi:hypothetical protein RZR97_11300 [Hydrogenimonas thermophila]|uniref:hypothetical protein n=1 Tax=Hydrogenimonas thermophila TaxID=223786 RepID=UPI002936EED8|nr:hypothetical protein [Hydrogenimonas thermophila]WOE69681.1 hypothetical protein RZR91_11310 [Hydrogenimonas thermophila]WOE72195.1 hypothetical protein RZR97_11300 [Hydrogenimonas thermophila]
MSDNQSFSEFFHQKLEKEKESFFYSETMIGAYIVGAYASAIIHSSWRGAFQKSETGEWIRVSRVEKNETFKKWLSNQQIVRSNLIKIADKAAEFHRRFNLDSNLNQELAQLVTDYLKPKVNDGTTNAEVSFAFLRGYNDFLKYKKGDIDENSTTK